MALQKLFLDILLPSPFDTEGDFSFWQISVKPQQRTHGLEIVFTLVLLDYSITEKLLPIDSRFWI